MRKKFLSLLLVLCMMVTLLLSASALADELDNRRGDDAANVADDKSSIVYSDTRLTINADSYLNESGGSYPVTLTRSGDTLNEEAFSVVVYDNSTNYDVDYRISYNGKAVKKLDGATSVYDAFRDNGKLTSGLAFELAVTEALTDDELLAAAEDVSAAAAFAQLDDLGAKAAEFTVNFAAGERTAGLTIEVLDDAEPEYEETFFMAVLDGDGEVIDSAQQAFAIVDNDAPAPGVTVAFDCDGSMELTDDEDAVELMLRRSGDLATTTLVTVYVNGEIYGQVDFTPWQEVQTFDAVVGGVYTLDGNTYGIEVIDNTTAELSVANGADPELDSLPEEYAVIPTPRQGDMSDVSWVPAWANGTEGDTEYQKIILGSKDENLFKDGGHSDSIKGELTFYVDGKNIHEISTSGTGSGIPSGNRNMDSIDPIDLTGVESIETTVKLTGLDHEAEIKFGIEGHDWNTIKLDRDNDAESTVHTFVATVYDGDNNKLDYRQAGKHVYYSNVDPDGILNRGTNLFVPNALKLNLRVYRFRIEGKLQDMGGNNADLLYTNSKAGDEPVLPSINYGTDVQYLTINSKDYGEKKTVDICYSSERLYPAKLIGYKLMAKDGHCSDLISLGSGAEAEDTISFTFDADFLKKYEAEYCYREASDVRGEYWTFHVIPIYEKIKYSTLNFLSATAGDIEIVQGSEYMGDRWVFGAANTSAGSQLSGVWYQAKSWKAYSIPEQGITQTRPDAAKNEFALDIEYPIYTVQGVFSDSANRLNLEYEPNRTYKDRGTAEQIGELVSEDDYVVGDYIPLIAKSKNSLMYQVRWHVSGSNDYLHGDVFYYQLDGNPDHNTVYLEYVPTDAYSGTDGESYEETTYGNITGTLKQAQVEARANGLTTFVSMANTTVTVRNGGQEFTATTDENGHFTLKNFRGIAGGTYSMAILYEDSIGYTTFTYQPNEEITIELPQFGIGVPYPELVAASVDGGSTDNVALVLTDNSKISASTRVFVPSGGYEITGVKYYFVDPKIAAGEGKNAPTTVIVDTTHDVAADNDSYEVWRATITDTSQLTSGMHMYVEIIYKKDLYQNGGSSFNTSLSSGLVNTGYAVAAATNAESFAASYNIPSTPNMQSTAFGGDISQITIPVLGKLDLSLTSKTGGFFVQRTDGENTILMCGSSYLASFGTGTVAEKLQQKRATDKALAAARDKDKGGSANPGVTALSGEPSEQSVLYRADTPSKWSFNPAYLFRFTFSPKDDGTDECYLSQFEMALGVDSNYIRNIPFSVYGVPFYVCLTFTNEAYFDVQAEFAKSKDLDANDISENLIIDSGSTAIGDDTKVASFIAAPMMNMGVKGGVGHNNFLSLYLTASVNVPFIVEVYPNVIGAFNLTGNVGFGADLILFSASVNANIDVGTLGYNDEIKQKLSDLTTISPARTAGYALSADELDKMLDEITFAPMVRSTLRQAARSTSYDGVIASGVFKNTGIHLLKQKNGNILAFYLKDAKVEDTLNYLSVVYAKSSDGGSSWTEQGFVSDNTTEPRTSLQYDVNLFDLGDRTLVTWSEANFDEVLTNLGNVDINALTPAQIAKFMNAMDLKGCFFNTDGEPMGKAFTIAENSTVACGALDAVRNGDMVYVYYQRNIFPYDETAGTVTLEQLLSTDRTIAMARANVNDTDNWISTTVRATKNGTEQEYRITDVEPFVHNGIMGEILELDRDGRLAVWDETNEVWEPSNEDRQLYLRTYTFDENATPIASALMAITDPALCARSPQVVSNDDYLHLFWNQNGKVVCLTDFVATTNDSEAVQDCAYVIVDKNGNAVVNPTNKGRYVANDIAGDEHFHIGTNFTASMDDSGSVLLSWVATDTASAELTDEVYGVVLDTVTNAEAVSRAGLDDIIGSSAVYQLYAKGLPVVLTDSEEEKSLIGALDSVFVGRDSNESNFLLAFSKLDAVSRENATSADIKTAGSVYAPDLEITGIDVPAYPMPGSNMAVSVTVTNRGLGEAKNVSVSAAGVGNGAAGTIDSIMPGCSETIELIVAVPEKFHTTTTMTVKADNATENVEVRYGAHFIVKYMPEMSNMIGSSDYATVAQVCNAGNAAGIPTLNYAVSIFASDEPAKEYSYTADEEVPAGEIAYLSYVLADTPITCDSTGTLTLSVDVGEGELGAYQYIQGRMPKLKTLIAKSDLRLDDDSQDSSDDYVEPSPSKPTGGSTAGSVTLKPAFTDIPAGSWYEEAVSWAVNNEITTGTGSGLFSPDLFCTRAQAVTFLWRASGSPAPKSMVNPFADVPANAWYRDAMLWAVEQGITKGTGDGTTFSPDLACTRAQIVAFIYRLEQAGGGGFTGMWAMQLPFTDTPDWAYEAIAWCYMKGITDGTGNGLFSPNLSCTRAQIVTLLYRYSKI